MILDGYFQDNINLVSDQKLCEIVVAARYLGSMRDEAILAMQELARRRETGSLFEYETVIDALIQHLPNFKVNINKQINLGLGFPFKDLK